MARTIGVYTRTETPPYCSLTASQGVNNLDHSFSSTSTSISDSSSHLNNSDSTIQLGATLIGHSYKEKKSEPRPLSTRSLRVNLESAASDSPPPLKKKSFGFSGGLIVSPHLLDYRRASPTPLGKQERKLLRYELDQKIQNLKELMFKHIGKIELDFKTHPYLKTFEEQFLLTLENIKKEDEIYKKHSQHPSIRTQTAGESIPLNQTQIIMASNEEMSESDVLIWKNKVVRQLMPERIEELKLRIFQLEQLNNIIEIIKKCYPKVKETAVQ
jgi:hypothetical protein